MALSYNFFYDYRRIKRGFPQPRNIDFFLKVGGRGALGVLRDVMIKTGIFMRLVMAIIFTLSFTAAFGKEPSELLSRSIFFAQPDVVSPKLSPDGKWLSYLALEKGRVNIWVAPVKNPRQARPLITDSRQSVYTYQWANNRLIYQTGKLIDFWVDNKDGKDYALHAIDLNGTDKILTKPLSRRHKFRVGANEIFLSPSSRTKGPHMVQIININTRAIRTSDWNENMAPVHADAGLTPRLVQRANSAGGIDILSKNSGAWQTLLSLDNAAQRSVKIFGFSAAGDVAYIAHAQDSDRNQLVALNLVTGTQKILAAEGRGEITDILTDRKSRKPVAVRYRYLQDRWTILDARWQQAFDDLAAGAPGNINILSQNKEGSLWLVEYSGGQNAGAYYLYNTETRRTRYLFSAFQGHKPQDFSPMSAHIITARDGLELIAYLTLPKGQKKPHPLVMWVHGGPVARGYGKFDEQAQWLTARGYAVLSVNFRGGRGFGKNFIKAGWGQWGKAMQDDLLDAANWAISKNIATKGEIALLGLSYGGYATLNALADGPGLFKCGIEIAGLSDLNLFAGDIAGYINNIKDATLKEQAQSRQDRDALQMGGDFRTAEGRAYLASISPVNRAASITQDLMIVHGLKDRGVRPEHSHRLRAALKKQGRTPVYVTYADAGHGLIKKDNIRSFAAVSELFLHRCLGGKTEPMTDAERAASTMNIVEGHALLNEGTK